MTEELRRDVSLPLVVLMVMAVLVSTGTVALLQRMAPAIQHIVSENIFSLEAGEEMLGIVAAAPVDADTRARFDNALARAQGNVTEEREREHLEVVRRNGPAALQGDSIAKQNVIGALFALSETNRSAIVRGDEEAQRLGYAGAWAAVFLGVLAFTWGLIATRRARRRIIEPLREVGDVLASARSGDRYRRCRRMPAPVELERIMTGVDDLLDARALRHFAEEPPLRAVSDRAILLHMLERRQRPAWVVTVDGSVEAANRAGLDELSGEQSADLKSALSGAPTGAQPAWLQVDHVEGAERGICERAAAA